jgi:hypothetical protein
MVSQMGEARRFIRLARGGATDGYNLMKLFASYSFGSGRAAASPARQSSLATRL